MRRERPLILAVDDEAATRALLHKLLNREGYDVVEAVDGESALRAVVDEAPDLVCLDVMMPEPGGIEVCQQLRRHPEYAGLPILLLTALDRPEDKVGVVGAGDVAKDQVPADLRRIAPLNVTPHLHGRDQLGRHVAIGRMRIPHDGQDISVARHSTWADNGQRKQRENHRHSQAPRKWLPLAAI